jgi:hypothetical protein
MPSALATDSAAAPGICVGAQSSQEPSRHFVNGFDFFGGGHMSLFEIAVVADHGSRLGGVQVHFFAEAGSGFGCGRRLVPFDLEKLTGLHGGPGGVGEDGNASAGVIAAAGAGRFAELMGEVRGLQLEHATDVRGGFYFGGVEAQRRTTVNGAAFDRGDEHSGEAGVQTEFGGTGDFQFCVGAPRGPADESKVRRILQWRIRGRLERGSGGEELFKGKPALGMRLEDKAIFGAAFRVLNVPLCSGSREKHLASASAGFAKRIVRSANTAATAGELIAKFRFEVGLHNLYAAPIAAEFFRDNHRKGGENALTHLGLAAPDLYVAARRKFKPSVWQEGIGGRGPRDIVSEPLA